MNFWNQFPGKELIIASSTQEGRNKTYHVNAHMHTPYSFSAFDSIDHALSLAKGEDVHIVGINDFYTTNGYQEWAEKCVNYKVFPLFNIEFIGLSPMEQDSGVKINDPKNPGRIYLSGKGLSYPQNLDESCSTQLHDLVRYSNHQNQAMVSTLNLYLKNSGIPIQLSFDEIMENDTMGLVRERHLAKALRKKVVDTVTEEKERIDLFERILNTPAGEADLSSDSAIENEIRNRLLKSGGVAFIPESPKMFIDLVKIKEIILKSGGIPTYPLLADSVNGGFTEFEEDKEALLKWLKRNEIYSVEFITNRNSTEVLEEYARFFMDNSILVTFGSEHNTPELIPVKLKNKSGEDLSPALVDINYSGACIIAAHQYLTAQTGQGLLEENGTLIPGKMDELKELGAGLLEYYFSN